MKAQISVTEALLIVGSIAVSSLLFLSLIDEVKEWSYLLTLSSAESVAKDIANLISISGASPANITVYHQLPEVSYNTKIKERFVNVTLTKEAPFEIGVENVSTKIAVDIYEAFCPYVCTGVSECKSFGGTIVEYKCEEEFLYCCYLGGPELPPIFKPGASEMKDVKKIGIEKFVENGKNVYGVRKVE